MSPLDSGIRALTEKYICVILLGKTPYSWSISLLFSEIHVLLHNSWVVKANSQNAQVRNREVEGSSR